MWLLVPPGAPTVPSAGPALPADDTKTTPDRATRSVAWAMRRPALGVAVASP